MGTRPVPPACHLYGMYLSGSPPAGAIRETLLFLLPAQLQRGPALGRLCPALPDGVAEMDGAAAVQVLEAGG